MQNPKIQAILECKRKEDPIQFERAKNGGYLLQYISIDLRKAGIDPTHVNIPQTPEKMNLDVYVTQASTFLDDKLYEPYYQATLSSNHMNLAEIIAMLKSSKKLESRLKEIKVGCALTSLFFLGMSLKCLSSSNLVGLILCGILTADSLRVSYNCYLKKYCSLAISYFTHDAGRLATSVFKLAQSAIGMQVPNDDPWLQFKNQVMIELLTDHTLTKEVFNKIIKVLK